jgi:hypothetical protein
LTAPLYPVLARMRRQPLWTWPAGSVVLGRTSRGKDMWVPADMRAMHMLIMGATGAGKSKVLESMLRQDFGCFDGVLRGAIGLDPHGTLIKAFVEWYAAHGLDKFRPIRILRPGDPHFTVGLNPVRKRPGVDPAVIASAVTNALLRSFKEEASQKPQTRETLKMCFYAMVEHELPLREATYLLSNDGAEGLRAWVAQATQSDEVRQFWRTIEALKPSDREPILGAARRRLNELLLPEAMRRIFGYHERALDLRESMDAGEIILVDLSYDTGRVSEDETTLLGSLILADVFLSCLGRPEDATPCYLYVDEVARFITQDIANLLEQARKFRLGAVLCGQALGQIEEVDPRIYRSVMANARTKVILGGLDDDDCTVLARNLFRGWLDLEEPMHRFDRREVVGYDLEWLLSDSQTHGAARSTGTAWSQGGSVAAQQSTTHSRSTAETDGVSVGVGVTRSHTETDSQSTTRSRSVTESESTTEAEMEVHTESQSHGEFQSAHAAAGQSYDYAYDPIPFGQLPIGVHASEIAGEGSGSADTTSSSVSSGRSTAHTRGTAVTEGIAETEGRAVSEGIAEHETLTRSRSIGRTSGTAETAGTTRSSDWSQGGNQSVTASEAATQGRSQSRRPVLAVVPGTAYPLDKLIARAAWQIGNLPNGSAIVKIGRRPPAKIKTLYLKSTVARPEHVARVCREQAEQTPYLTRTAEVTEAHRKYRTRLLERVREKLHGTRDDGDVGEWS